MLVISGAREWRCFSAVQMSPGQGRSSANGACDVRVRAHVCVWGGGGYVG
eukprot:CAMPEP_0119368864 /NCGR_PEP_ID=MMETSP1334-20130426/15470_1 /TAXON_ID=127549 /ORGANISM="Calcidiscus leptoporus, Strain RCC1130" /LENGTH=49 /DNA_ID= /DNA_START= /DNA_END= /DNA_ORIENTATION=